MKIILVGLLITILAVQRSSSNQDNHTEQDPLISVGKMEILLEKQFRKVDESIGRLEEKFEAIHKIKVAEKRRKEFSKFDKIGSKYYYIDHTEKVTWLDAFYKCRSMGLHLAELKNREELIAVSEKLTQNNYWLDMTECVNLEKTDSDYEMNSDDCESHFNYICEKDDWEEGRLA